MSKDVTELLHADHQKVRELFFQFSKADSDKEKNMLVKQILTELYIHAEVEEKIVYPEVENEAEEGEQLIGEAENEHRVVKFLMAELSKMSAGSEDFDSKVTVLCELVNHHIREEEKEMFEKLRESGADLEGLAEEVAAKKAELQEKPLPAMHATLEIAGDSAKKPYPSKSASKAKKKSA
ncbi:MAG TPA: hemerythrin domain-containing protein [Planktothrix sp.]